MKRRNFFRKLGMGLVTCLAVPLLTSATTKPTKSSWAAEIKQLIAKKRLGSEPATPYPVKYQPLSEEFQGGTFAAQFENGVDRYYIILEKTACELDFKTLRALLDNLHGKGGHYTCKLLKTECSGQVVLLVNDYYYPVLNVTVVG